MDGDKTVNYLLESAPLPQMIEGLGKSIANAQFALDKYAIDIMREAGKKEGAGVKINDNEYSLLDLGLTPSFYHFSEARLSAKVAFSVGKTSEKSLEVEASLTVDTKVVMFAASVNAYYSNKYSFKSEGSSEINTKLISVPPPTVLVEILNEARAKS
ncbi:hypothetical protein [Marinibactrum halimedae]|uniref:Uncharacterized protein n=1 Tax=Marinibactrum halimedae TaxID=1444977 RepID=A0AA37SZY0_9GAMM|nr:hypothetical protein [Marinibactrum halimedae]MCD9460272.1 hypothetical protein [Marinibactrum halimedae]GLS24359.1 hypothetical protein GCM10007877_00700 [Marinibactrum halimedae]